MKKLQLNPFHSLLTNKTGKTPFDYVLIFYFYSATLQHCNFIITSIVNKKNIVSNH